MAEYTLSEACVLLGISRRTLDYWLQEAGINARNLPTDARKKALTMAQITKLAAAHGKRVKEVEGLAGLVVEVAALREQVEVLEAVKGQMEALEARVLALEARPSIRPSISIPATPAPVQSHSGLSSAAAFDPADLADTAKRLAARSSMPAPSHALRPGEAARLLHERHGANFDTVRQWNWPASALASEEAALRWALEYVAGDYRRQGKNWIWRCSVWSCPCHQPPFHDETPLEDDDNG